MSRALTFNITTRQPINLNLIFIHLKIGYATTDVDVHFVFSGIKICGFVIPVTILRKTVKSI